MTVNITIASRQIGDDLTPTVNGRDLHAELGVKKDFTDWIKAQIKRAMLVEDRDYVKVPQKGELSATGQVRHDYHLTIEASKHIAMMSGTARGAEVREYFLECERRAKAAVPAVKDPRTAALIDALVRQDALEQEQARQATELARLQENVAVIEARTQPENKHFTVLGYSNLIGRPVDARTAANLGRKCAALSREKGLIIGDVRDARFGTVHSYHESVLQEVLATATNS
ncbi:MAG: antA/AntB antirepressor family protein [Proteobacteria bacterium]|nr:antA/AntB antirepressor family protein [Pseudomonadota bacterium]